MELQRLVGFIVFVEGHRLIDAETEISRVLLDPPSAVRTQLNSGNSALATDTGHRAHRKRPVPKIVLAAFSKRLVARSALVIGEEAFVADAFGERVGCLTEAHLWLCLPAESANSTIFVAEENLLARPY
jgi:hypothetical protein